MEKKRRHFRLDVTQKEIMATLENEKKEKIKLQIYDISKQGISFYIRDAGKLKNWRGRTNVKFKYDETSYEFNMNFVRLFKKGDEEIYAGEFDGKDLLKMSRLSLKLMSEKLKED